MPSSAPPRPPSPALSEATASTASSENASDVLSAVFLPELFAFLGERALAALTECASDINRVLRERGAWRSLAQSRDLPLVPSARAMELDAIAQLKSQAHRRWLATSRTMDVTPRIRTPRVRLDTGFTYFVRVLDDGVLNRVRWEGDLAGTLGKYDSVDPSWGSITFDLSRVWSDTAGSWDAMRHALGERVFHEAPRAIRDVEFVIIAVRNVDQAMLIIGRFEFMFCNSIYGDETHNFTYFAKDASLRNIADQTAKFRVSLDTTHDPAGGYLNELTLEMTIGNPEPIDTCNLSQLTTAVNALATRANLKTWEINYTKKPFKFSNLGHWVDSGLRDTQY